MALVCAGICQLWSCAKYWIGGKCLLEALKRYGLFFLGFPAGILYYECLVFKISILKRLYGAVEEEDINSPTV